DALTDRDLQPFPTRRSSDLRGVEKDPQRARERLGLLPVDEVAAVLEADQLAVLQQGGGGRAMGDGKDGVACSPEEAHGWKLLDLDRKSTRLNSSHVKISYAV